MPTDTERSAFFSSLGMSMAAERKRKKSDDIIDFIKDHWKFFFTRRSDMMDIVNQLGDTVPYTVDALCDQLALPSNVYFQRSPVVNIADAVLHFRDSKFWEMFNKCCSAQRSGEACLFIVAGKSSLCITNMQTSFDQDKMIMYWLPSDNTSHIHIFLAEEAPIRLPSLFDPNH